MLGVPVLCYHGVGPACSHGPALFETHLDLLEDQGYTTITARELVAICRGQARPTGRQVLLTFDDGHVSNWLYAAPALARRGMTGVFFPVTDFIVPGAARTRETAPPDLPERQGFLAALAGDPSHFMNEGELTALVRDLGMEVHSHSARHQLCFRSLSPKGRLWAQSHWGCAGIYPRLDPAYPEFEYASAYAYNGFWPRFDPEDTQQRRPVFRLRPARERLEFCLADFTRSLERVRAINGEGEQLFCWPWGHYDPLAERALKQAGYAGAFTLDRGMNGPDTDPFRLRRIGVGAGKGAGWLRSRLRLHQGALTGRFLTRAFRKKPEIGTVLYVTNSRLLSGGSRQMVNNALAMADMGLTAYVAVPPHSEIVEALAESPVTVIPHEGFDSYLGTARFLARTVAERHVDVVHAFHSKAMKAALLAKLLAPRFRLFVNRGVIYNPNPLFFLWAAVSQGVVCNSRVCAGVLRRFLVSPDKLNVVHNSFLADGPLPLADAGAGGEAPLFLYVGNMAEVKGFDVFLAAVARYRELFGPGGARFAAVGVEEKERFAGKIPAPNPADILAEVDSPGRLPHAQVLARLAQAQVLVLTSRQESMPNVLAEGFAAGLPVVSTAVGGVPELVRDGLNGYLCASEDAEALARAMHTLAGDPSGRARMGRINRRLVAELLDNRIKGQKLLAVYFGRRQDEPLDIAGLAREEE